MLENTKGKSDFIDLEGHKHVLEKLIKKDIKFFTWNQKYLEAITKMDNTK